MIAVVIEGIAPWDGRYEFEDFTFTNRELYRVKQVSGLRASELIDAIEANDTSAYVAVADVVLSRTDKKVPVDDLWNGPVGSIMLDFGEVVADPPTRTASGNEPNVTESSSGDGSTNDGAPSPSSPPPTGSRSSEEPAT